VAPQKNVTEQFVSRMIKRTTSASSQQLPHQQQARHILFNNFNLKPPLAQLSHTGPAFARPSAHCNFTTVEH